MDRPIPLRPDPFAWREKERRSFTRACAALAMTTKGSTGHHAPAAEVLRTNWKYDSDAREILKAERLHPLRGNCQRPSTQCRFLVLPRQRSCVFRISYRGIG